MTSKEYEVFRTLPKTLKDLIVIGETACDLTVISDKKNKLAKNGIGLIEPSILEKFNHNEIELQNRLNDLIRIHLNLERK